MTLPTTETTRSTDDEIIDSISTSYDFGWYDSDEAGEASRAARQPEPAAVIACW